MSEHESPSEGDYLNGHMPDGSRPSMPSGLLYQHWEKPIPGGDEDKSPAEIEQDRLHYEIDRQLLDDLDLSCEFARKMVRLGLRAIDHPEEFAAAATNPARKGGSVESASADAKASSSPAREGGDSGSALSAIPALSRGAEQDAGAEQCGAEETRTGGGGRPYSGGFANGFNTPRLRSVGEGDATVVVPDPPVNADPDINSIQRQQHELERMLQGRSRKSAVAVPKPGELKLDQAVLIGERGSKLLMSASAKRTEIAHRLVDRALLLDTRKSFMQDRAVALVYATLLHLDESFREIGFGSWMPFRFPDQWLSFCGIMRRVLAANGLIHSEHADVYRKLLDETPPVEIEGELRDRIKQSKTPMKLGLCHENRGADTLADLAERLEAEVYNPPKPPPRKQYAR